MNPDYESKGVIDWMDEMCNGELALTDFQRSHVWSDKLTAKFLTAVLQEQPTGTVLVVESGNGLGRRKITGNDADITQCQNLILDGQQRLTSLWQGLTGNGKRCFYVKVNDLTDKNLEVLEVAHRFGDLSPKSDYSGNSVPLSVLYDPPADNDMSKSRLQDWCEDALPNDAKGAGDLRLKIKKHIQKPLQQYKIWFGRFTGLSVDKAAKIFTETNSSSVNVTPFDLAVAQALDIRSDVRLRERIQRFRENYPQVEYYFHTDQQRWIPEIGEWLLKIACLKISSDGLPPKNGNFEKALRYLFDNGTANADKVESNLVAALRFLEDNGVPTKDILPRIPPVYVIAALQDELSGVDEMDKSNTRALLSEYLWRSFFSDRYKVQANDGLYDDFKSLRNDIKLIKQGKAAKKNALVFEAGVVEESDLWVESKTFKSRTSLGNAIIALSLCGSPEDWVTGEPLTTSRIRELEKERQLDRHHVFPRKALIDGDDGEGKGGLDNKDPFIHHGLNIVLIRKPANIKVGGKKPASYLKEIRKKSGHLTDVEFKKRIESHRGIPYATLTCLDGEIVARYKNYLKKRAGILWEAIKQMTTLSETAQDESQ